MAANRVYARGQYLKFAVTHPATPSSGDPVRIGSFLTGVARGDEDAAGNTVVDLGPAVYDLSVKGENDGGDAALAVGDKLYYDDDDAGVLSAKATSNFFFGYLLEAQGSGITSLRHVLLKGITT